MIVRPKKRRRHYFIKIISIAISVVVFCFVRVVKLVGTLHDETSSLLSLPTNHDQGKELIEQRNKEIANVERIPGNFPSLSSLIVATAPITSSAEGTITYNQELPKVSLLVIGDVQFLLDYAIVGFSKCGTTTLLKWIRRDPDVRTFKREIHEIINDNPGPLIERLYQNLLEVPVNTTTTTLVSNSAESKKNFLQGFKNPEILQVPSALHHIHTYWPETKLIVSVRNPLKWFRSFYNFRLTIGHLKQVGADPNALIGHCDHGNKVLCTHMGAFHVKLFRLGKTELSPSPGEFDLLKPFLSSDDNDIWSHMKMRRNGDDASVNSIQIPRMRNKIFFLDLRQLSDGNRTRAKLFREDLQHFLGLKHELSPVFRARPFKQLELTLDEESKQHKINSICDPQYLPLQAELFHMAQNASLWIRQYFLKSPDVIVSSPEYVEELLETWMQNPCDQVDPGNAADG